MGAGTDWARPRGAGVTFPPWPPRRSGAPGRQTDRDRFRTGFVSYGPDSGNVDHELAALNQLFAESMQMTVYPVLAELTLTDRVAGLLAVRRPECRVIGRRRSRDRPIVERTWLTRRRPGLSHADGESSGAGPVTEIRGGPTRRSTIEG